MSDLHHFLEAVQQPEYVHVLLNPIPVYGMAAGAFVLLVSLLRREDRPVGSLLWLFIAAVLTAVAFQYGTKGYDRTFAMSGGDAQKWLDVHVHRAESTIWLFYAVGVAALMSLIGWKKPKFARTIAWITVLLALTASAVGGWISQAGGQVRHSEFRNGPPPNGAKENQ